MFKRFGWFGIIILIVGLLAACSSANDNASSTNSSHSMNMEQSVAMYAADMDGSAPASTNSWSGAGADDSGSAESAGAGGFLPDEKLDGFNRKLMYRANVTMEVTDFATAQTDIRNKIHLFDGYILEFSEQSTVHEASGNFLIKVPAAGFHSFLDALSEMEPVSIQRSVRGQDVTEEYVDLEARLSAKQVVEARLLDFMENASRTDELLSFSNELERVQEEIERFKGRMRYIDQNVSYSTVELRLYEKIEAKKSSKKETVFGDRISDAIAGSLQLMSVFFQELIVFLAGALPVLLVLMVIAVPIVYIIRRFKK